MKTRWIGLVAAFVLAGSADAWAQARRAPPIDLTEGGPPRYLRGSISGYDGAEHLLRLKRGQQVRLRMTSNNRSAYFNVTAPGAKEALFIGSRAGDSFAFTAPAGGDYRVTIYLMRNAARRAERAAYQLTVALPVEQGRPR